jgi:signal peptidase I
MEITRNPWGAVLLSLMFPGLGQFYNGQALKSGAIVIASFGTSLLFGALRLTANPTGFAVMFIFLFCLHIYQLVDAYIVSKRNRNHKLRFYNRWYYYLVFAAFWLVTYIYKHDEVLKVQAFSIPTQAMENTVLVGDRIIVELKPSSVPSNSLIVFHVPGMFENNWGISPENWTVRATEEKVPYIKRCVGLPGQVLKISTQVVETDGKPLPAITTQKYQYEVVTSAVMTERTIDKLKLTKLDVQYSTPIEQEHFLYLIYLTDEQAKELAKHSFIISIIKVYRTENEYMSTFPKDNPWGWATDNYGPIAIPNKGMTIAINDSTLALYGELIENYEGNESVMRTDSSLDLSGKKIIEYQFKQNYYFVMGDNRHNSHDSRYWGFVPEDHIIGIPRFVYFSFNKEKSTVRWNRLLMPIE